MNVASHPADHPADGADALLLGRQLCFGLYAATNLIQRLYRPHLAPLGLTYSQYLVLLVLWERGEASVGEVRDCLHLDPGTITPLLKRMERAGLVVRRRDPADERRVLVGPTPPAMALRPRAAAIPAALGARIGLAAEPGAALHGAVHALVGRLQAALSHQADHPSGAAQENRS